jgi:ankyrin repeat protein
MVESLVGAGAKVFTKNKFGDTFLHIAVRHGHSGYVLDAIDLIYEQIVERKVKNKFPLDIENGQENCTPYMLALLRENFRLADALMETGFCDKYYKNKQKQTVLDIVSKYNMKAVQKYLVVDNEKERERNEKQKQDAKDAAEAKEKAEEEEKQKLLAPEKTEDGEGSIE